MSFSFSLTEPNLKIPPLINQEVKLEPDAAPSINLPPSTCYLEDSAVKSQSTLLNMLSYIQSMRAMFQAKEAKTLPWSLVMHNPINLAPLSKYKSEYEKVNLDPKPQPVQPKRKRVVKGPYKKRIKPQEATAATEESKIKKEEQIEEPGKCTSDKDPKSAAKDPSKKKPQNRIKNIPGLVVQRVRSSIKTFFAQDPSTGLADKRLGYISKTLGTLNKSERENLLAFLEGYDKSWKTWNTIQIYMKKNIKCGAMLLDAVLEFFREDGRQDFQEWLTVGKMCDKTKLAVIEMKDKIYRKYCHLLDPEVETGKKDQEKVPEPPEKMVKKEEH